jgi:hypothetical protein
LVIFGVEVDGSFAVAAASSAMVDG